VTPDPASAKLTLRQVAVLAILLAEGRQVSNSELRERAGVALTGADRAGLTRLNLVEEHKVGNTYSFALTPTGWSTCPALLANQSLGKGAASGALVALIGAVHRGLQRDEVDPRSFFTAETPAVPAPAGPPVPAEALAPADLEAGIRAAYRSLAKQPADWVGLADLRDRLGDAPRVEVDAALRRIAVKAGVRLIPVANLKSLTVRDREAALRLGGEDNHAIAIEAR
jgi:hypothetical protein